jgi:hypothetical protein
MTNESIRTDMSIITEEEAVAVNHILDKVRG